MTDLPRRLRAQAEQCALHGSPLTAALLVHEGQHDTAARLAGAADHLRADSYVGAPMELAAREWLHRRLTHALGPAVDTQRLAGRQLDRIAALTLAAESLG